MEIVEANRDLIKNIELPEGASKVYLAYYNDNRDDLKSTEGMDAAEIIKFFEKEKVDLAGYGFITNHGNNDIEMFIKEDFRGIDYGEELFARLLKDCDKEILNFNIALENYPMIRILEKFNAVDIGTNNGIVKYVLKKD